MADGLLYDDLFGGLQAEPGAFDLSNGLTVGFTFTTGAQAGTLGDVVLGIFDANPNDGGSVDVRLLKPSSGPFFGTEIAFLGSIQDSNLSDNRFARTDIPITQTIKLDPNTTYTIQATGVRGSKAILTNQPSGNDSGTGVAGNYTQIFNQTGTGGQSPNYVEGAITARVTETVCFATGTRIRTTRGECAVQDLRVGDVAVTASGETRPIVWIGHRDIDCHGRHELHPVLVAAHAFGVDLPARDLWLSPGHPVLVGADEDNEGGYLVPIMCLINGTTIRRVGVERVTYWHVELDSHNILLAEGLPAESYLDWGDRAFFAESSDHALANPDFIVPGLAGRCRPVALDGPVVEAERRRLDAVFATHLTGACAWPKGDADAVAF